MKSTNCEKTATIYVANEESASKLSKSTKIANTDVTIFRKAITVRGIIKGIPKEYSSEDLIGMTQAPVKILNAERQKWYNRDNKTLEDSYAVKLTFESNSLPSSVWSAGRKREVLPYVRRILQCHKCQRYGHVQKYCRAQQPKCLRCAGNHDSGVCQLKNKDIQNRTNSYTCENCKGWIGWKTKHSYK